MPISVDDYLAEVRADLPEARELLDRLAESHEGVDLVWQLNTDLTHLLLWSWRSGDRDTCARILGVMERGLIDTADGEHAPVWNSVGIGVVEVVHRDLAADDFAEFVQTWPPTLREQGLMHERFDDDEWADDMPELFQIPLGLRVRWALRHPVRSRLGTRITFAV
jgi:hypothetical protein